ncbi:MAG: hypothetical protein P0111_12120 [Nitrospira sp.]|nr:hypothetical protein [Nitrospira sp.]
MRSQTAHSHTVASIKSVAALMASFAISLVATACVSPEKPQVMIHEDPRGAVYLEDMADASFHATHPLLLDSAVIAHVLQGMFVEEDQRLLQTLVAGKAIPVRTFSDEDAEFLAPHIVVALSRATALQRVRFRVINTTAAGTETTGGALYTSGRSFHVSLTQYRYNPEKPIHGSKPGRQLPDRTGLDQHRVLFLPDSAVRPPDSDAPTAYLDKPAQLTVVVDYEALAQFAEIRDRPMRSLPLRAPQTPMPEQAHAPAHTREPPAATTEDLQSMRVLLEKQADEVEALKKQLESLQRQQTEAAATSPTPKTKKQPASRVPGATP